MPYSTYSLIAYAWISLGVITFFYLLYAKVAPFGRHIRAGWGPTVDNRLGWILMEAVVLMVFFVFLAPALPRLSGPVIGMVSLFVGHYVHRSLIYPWFLRTRGKRMPMAIAGSAMGFNTMNGFLMGYYFANFADYPADWLSDTRFLAGLFVFFLGAGINISTDYALIRLRAAGESGYAIPRGRLFQWISCPNHFGEMLEWCGFALLTWSLPGFAFAVWTAANLIPRALAHHRWYQEKFPDYPAERKAFLPFTI